MEQTFSIDVDGAVGCSAESLLLKKAKRSSSVDSESGKAGEPQVRKDGAVGLWRQAK